jgi:uncharacterized protein (DUF736 family)
MNKSDKTEFERIGAMWRHTDKRGKQYLSGTVGDLKIVIFPNTQKAGERSPDFIVFKSEMPANTLFGEKRNDGKLPPLNK